MGLWESARNWIKKNVLRQKEEEPQEEPTQETQEQQTYELERPGEQTQQQQPTKEPRETRELKRRKVKPKTQMEQAKQRIQTARPLKEIEEQIKEEGLNQVQIPITSDLSALRRPYETVLTQNAKLEDTQILNILIENRAKLKHRFSAKLEVYGNGTLAGILNITGILMEDCILINNYLTTGQTLKESNELQTIFTNIGNIAKQEKGATGSPYEIYIPTGFQVTELNLTYTFA